MKYRLIALDVDGTLVGPDSLVAPELSLAVRDVAASGVRVVLATGRSYIETVGVWRQLELPPPREPMVLIGGALVAEPDTGRTLYQSAISRELSVEYADALCAEGFSAACIVDAWRHGLDYVLAESADAGDVWQRWFGQMRVNVRRVRSLRELAGGPDVLRINAVVKPEQAAALEERMQSRFGERLNIHSILAPNYGVTVVEAFGLSTSKWQAVRYVAQTTRIGPGQIIAVGDDVNDLPMLAGAGLGVAMPQSPPHVKLAAKQVAENGLAEFLRRLSMDNH
jgi:Cof subfamily protein (haloacid dehalogenase superfamily)